MSGENIDSELMSPHNLVPKFTREGPFRKSHHCLEAGKEAATLQSP